MEKHSWTEEELRIVCICYKENLPIELALRLTNTTNAKSMGMRYGNCLFLDKGRVDGSLSRPSKTLVKVWEEVKQLYPKEIVIEEKGVNDEFICKLILFMLIVGLVQKVFT